MLRLRRHLRGQRRRRLLRDGPRSHRRSRARRRGSDRRRRRLLPDASGRAAAARSQADPYAAHRRASGRGGRMNTHARRALPLLRDPERLHWHDQAVWFVRQKRDIARAFVPEWEELRSLGSQIKAHTLSRLADYLEQFEKAATAAGAVVHWARDATEHNQIVFGLLRDRG